LRLLQLIEVNRLSSCSRGLFNVKATTEAGKAFGAYPLLETTYTRLHLIGNGKPLLNQRF